MGLVKLWHVWRRFYDKTDLFTAFCSASATTEGVVGCMMRGVAIVGGFSSCVLGLVAARASISIISCSNGLLTITFAAVGGWIEPRPRMAYYSWLVFTKERGETGEESVTTVDSSLIEGRSACWSVPIRYYRSC